MVAEADGTALRAGQQVVVVPELPNGALQQSITVPDAQLYPVPESMPVSAWPPRCTSLHQTAYVALHHRAGLRAGHTVPITRAAGGVGLGRGAAGPGRGLRRDRRGDRARQGGGVPPDGGRAGHRPGRASRTRSRGSAPRPAGGAPMSSSTWSAGRRSGGPGGAWRSREGSCWSASPGACSARCPPTMCCSGTTPCSACTWRRTGGRTRPCCAPCTTRWSRCGPAG